MQENRVPETTCNVNNHTKGLRELFWYCSLGESSAEKNIIAIVLVIYAVFGGGLFDIFDNIKPSPIPEPEPVVEILNIDKHDLNFGTNNCRWKRYIVYGSIRYYMFYQIKYS